MDSDTQERLQNRLTDVQWQRQRWEFPALPLRNVAFRNRGDLTFEDATERWSFGTEEDISHTLAAGDLDGDGDQDVVVNRLRAPALILRNDGPAPRVAVRLIGDAPNTRAVGAKIRLLGGAIPTQEREVAVGGLYMSHSDYAASFAMGKSDSATLVIHWRDGRRTTIGDVRPNRLYEITQATATEPSRGDSLRPPAAPALFEDVTAQLGGHIHTDPPFDDWERQFLLPNSLSQLGPGVAWFDYDRDGDEDLLVGAGRGGRLAVFRNDGGRMVPQPTRGAPLPADLTTVLGFATRDASHVIAGLSTWETAPAAGAPGLPAALTMSATARGVAPDATPLLPPLGSSAGPLALGDIDGDGDLDLFVGGRAIPGQYPRDASSWLFRNDAGRFVTDSLRSAALRDVGLVSAALFADIDGDGDADLVLAREWESILLLLNERGRFDAAPASWGLARWTSRWNGLAAGDLDGDGRVDLVATSWGRNTMMVADSARPLILLHGAIGSGGEEEMLLAREDARVHGLAPLNSYPRVRVALPDLASRLGTFAAYADATVDQVLGPLMPKVARRSAVSLDHMSFMNRGDHFEPRSLPAEAQVAPAFYAGIADFDGDGAEDVVLGQNFSATAVGIPRYDAGRGLLLTGDGSGRFGAMSGSRSGIRIYGDQRGAAYADFDRDGRLDLAVSQNGAATQLLRNRGAEPGLRVHLRGTPSNPGAIGAQVRVVFGDRMGPVRELQAGSGYWSQNGAIQLFGVPAKPTAVWVRWPGGAETRSPVAAGTTTISVNHPPSR